MRLAIISHKHCWYSSSSPSGFVTDGGFPFQMMALSQLFAETSLIVPCSDAMESSGLLPLEGHNLTVRPLTPPRGRGIARKLMLPAWFMHNLLTLIREIRRADAVHTPIPGDVGTIGMILACLLRKPLFVRHCGNWFLPKTAAEHFWKWFMEQFAGGRKVMLATGGAPYPPSQRNPAIQWIFSTTLTESELDSCLVSRQLPAKQRLRLIIACRQDRAKGAGVVIESLPLILRDFPEVELDIVGDGPALNELKEQAKNLGVDAHITFHGKVGHKRVLHLLQQAHLFCYPTAASEGFPKIVLEALACGLPVITTRVSVLPQLIGKGCGIILEEQTPKAVAKAVQELLSNAARYQLLSEQAMQTARQYSLERWRDTIGERLRSAWQLKVSND